MIPFLLQSSGENDHQAVLDVDIDTLSLPPRLSLVTQDQPEPLFFRPRLVTKGKKKFETYSPPTRINL
jgi:hypothetical protein